ncbi:MAG: hypothetical protein JO097_19805, partial [Acidobacteriaceae bacterium]|nr:hypothetical protein [Acidobacteriaceae bacterium]
MNKNRHPEIVLNDEDAKRALRRRTRRDFLIGGLAAAAGVGTYEWIMHAKDDNSVPWPQRRVLDANGRLSKGYVSNGHRMPMYSKEQIQFLKVNGDIGLNPQFDLSEWKLHVQTGMPGGDFNLSLADIQALPRYEMITRFCCIEGWSVITQWAGARFSDFTKKYFRP